MSDEIKQELVESRLKKAEEAYIVACMTVERKLWNTVVSELYYTCFTW